MWNPGLYSKPKYSQVQLSEKENPCLGLLSSLLLLVSVLEFTHSCFLSAFSIFNSLVPNDFVSSITVLPVSFFSPHLLSYFCLSPECGSLSLAPEAESDHGWDRERPGQSLLRPSQEPEVQWAPEFLLLTTVQGEILAVCAFRATQISNYTTQGSARVARTRGETNKSAELTTACPISSSWEAVRWNRLLNCPVLSPLAFIIKGKDSHAGCQKNQCSQAVVWFTHILWFCKHLKCF